MPDLKKVVVDGLTIDTTEQGAQIIDKLQNSLHDSNKALADAKAEHKSAIDAKDEEIGKLKADLKTAEEAAVVDVDALVAARSELVTQVKAIDASIDPTGLTDAELRKAAVVAKLGDALVADAGDAEIAGMFKALSVAKPGNPVKDAMSGGLKLVNDHSKDDARSAYVARLTRKTKEA